MIEFFAYQQEVYRGFIPNEGQSVIVDKRRNYYTKLAEGSCTVKQCWETESELLKDHPNFVTPSHVPTQLEAQLIALSDHLKILELLGKIPKPPGA